MTGNILSLPTELRLEIYSHVFADLRAHVTHSGGRQQPRYHPVRSPAILLTCRLLHNEATPPFRERLEVSFLPLALRAKQQRLLLQGSDANMATVSPVLTWTRQICFRGPYTTIKAHPILVACRNLRLITLTVVLSVEDLLKYEDRTEDAMCQHFAALAQLALARYTGLGKRINSAKSVIGCRDEHSLARTVV
jgi:hypothetical protein